jgi:hypothetical protein
MGLHARREKSSVTSIGPSPIASRRIWLSSPRGHSYRLIGRELGLSKNTVADIVTRARPHSGE